MFSIICRFKNIKFNKVLLYYLDTFSAKFSMICFINLFTCIWAVLCRNSKGGQPHWDNWHRCCHLVPPSFCYFIGKSFLYSAGCRLLGYQFTSKCRFMERPKKILLIFYCLLNADDTRYSWAVQGQIHPKSGEECNSQKSPPVLKFYGLAAMQLAPCVYWCIQQNQRFTG